VIKENPNDHVGRRKFIKTTALASVAATIPGTALLGQGTEKPSKPKPDKLQKKVLCLSESQTMPERLISSIKSIPGTDLLVTSISVNFQNSQEISQAISGRDPDFLLICLSGFRFSYGSFYDFKGDSNIPIIIFTTNPELILLDVNLAASLRGNGANVTFAISEAQVLEFLRKAASPKILEGKRALLFGKPFESVSVPAHNLTADEIYKRTGVKIQYRSLEALEELLKGIDEAGARSEMERWKKEAAAVVRVPDKAILDVCRLYVLLRSLIEKEGLSAVSIDCLSFTMGFMGSNLTLPIPCLAFARLRDEGFTAACEADVCGLLSSMFLQEVSRKPSFMANVMSVDLQKSSFLFSHCVSPLKLNGSNAAPMRYRLHDYHNMGRGVVPEVEFPIGTEVIIGAFSKNLKSFSLWPGRIHSQVKETELTSARGGGLNACANTMDVKIKDAGRFLQNIESIHHIMITGNDTKAIEDALFGMNVSIAAPSDCSAPEPERKS
jgi:hypothetical protein